MGFNCSRSECNTTIGCAHRGPQGEWCWLEECYRAACQEADDAMLRLAIDRLPPFDAWPVELADKWFEQFFVLLKRARAYDLRKAMEH